MFTDYTKSLLYVSLLRPRISKTKWQDTGIQRFKFSEAKLHLYIIRVNIFMTLNPIIYFLNLNILIFKFQQRHSPF